MWKPQIRLILFSANTEDIPAITPTSEKSSTPSILSVRHPASTSKPFGTHPDSATTESSSPVLVMLKKADSSAHCGIAASGGNFTMLYKPSLSP